MLPLLLLLGVGAFLFLSKDAPKPPDDKRVLIKDICEGPYPPFLDQIQAKLDEVIASGKPPKEIAAAIRGAVGSGLAQEYLKDYPKLGECLLKVAEKFDKLGG